MEYANGSPVLAADSQECIGHLQPTGNGYQVHCLDCDPRGAAGSARVYVVNIRPYGQHCALCGKTLVEAASPAWGTSDLFDGHYLMRSQAHEVAEDF